VSQNRDGRNPVIRQERHQLGRIMERRMSHSAVGKVCEPHADRGDIGTIRRIARADEFESVRGGQQAPQLGIASFPGRGNQHAH
jgi:hypothetical protein